ncbi:MAG: hypothetical protein WKG01_19950 [Kofleriaceae bacterium]
MSIDRGDSHFTDAKTWNRACRHIGLFLWWASARGLASKDVDAKAIAKAPTKYFISQCDTKLWDDDFTVEGLAFAAAEYDAYLHAVAAYARQLGVGDYEIRESKVTTKHFFDWLDKRLTAWRAKPAKRTPARSARNKPAKVATKSATKVAAKVATKVAAKTAAKRVKKPAARAKKSASK